MRRSTPRRPQLLPSQQAAQILTVCVVDPRAEDYADWAPLAEANGVRITFCATADEALRHARSHACDLWIVNAELPGVSGTDLCRMLNSGGVRPSVYVIANQYSPAAERAAWCARATMFGCKGAHHDWLQVWLTQRRGPAPSHAHRARPTGCRLS